LSTRPKPPVQRTSTELRTTSVVLKGEAARQFLKQREVLGGTNCNTNSDNANA
jgi:hypothetical protein